MINNLSNVICLKIKRIFSIIYLIFNHNQDYRYQTFLV
jgi:hypothetical protein